MLYSFAFDIFNANSKLDIYFVPVIVSLIGLTAVLRYLSWPSFLWGGKKSVDFYSALLPMMLSANSPFIPNDKRTKVIYRDTYNNTPYEISEISIGNNPRTELSRKSVLTYVYIFNLGFNSKTHLLGVSTADALGNIDGRAMVSAYKFESVSLEGNFNNSFTMYCAPGQQIDARYIFGPDNMEIFIDYLKNYSWEMVGDKLYVVSRRMQDPSLKGLLYYSDQFIKDIQPLML